MVRTDATLRATKLAMHFTRLCAAMSWLLYLVSASPHGASAREAIVGKPAVSNSAGVTIYVSRPRELKLISFAFPISVDGQKSIDLSPGEFFVAARPAGHRVIHMVGGSILADVYGEFDAAAGHTYFVEIGPYSVSDPPGTQLLNSLFTSGAGSRGKILPGQANGTARFYLLDSEQGRAAINNLRNVTH
jgi:hypothetical protein